MKHKATKVSNPTQEFELIVSQGKKPWYELALAALFFSVAIFVLIRCGYFLAERNFTEALGDLFFFLQNGVISIAAGLYFSVTKTVLIDIDTDKLISRYHLGSFSRDKISEVPQLEYVAIYLNPKDYYEVNLWYKGNKHYKMYEFEKAQESMTFGREVAKKLKLDLLDKTVRGQSNWIEYNS